jgi:sarcosine oxidase, subunit beta
MQHTDVLIIGGGVIGSSIAYHLSLQKRQVLVCERAAVATEPAASWASAGGVRRQGRDPAEASLASEAIARWPSLEDELEADVQYRQGGNLLLAEDEERAAALAAHVLKQRALGFADVRLLDRAEVRAIVPAIADAVIAGSFSPAAGQADPALTTRAFAAAAQSHGAIYWTDTTCESLLTAGGSAGGRNASSIAHRGARDVGARAVGARTSRGDIAAEVVVLAAGAWSDTLAVAAGLRLPIRTQALQMLLSTPAPSGTLVPVVSALGRELSLKQLDNGAFLLGGGWPGDPAPDRLGYAMRTGSMEGNWAEACAVLPAVSRTQIARAWCGLEAMSVDGVPFVGFAQGVEGLCLAAGFSGHGFALAPAVGRAVADLLAGKPAPELDGLSPERIAHMPPERIKAFLRETIPLAG